MAASATPIVAWLAYQGTLPHGVLFVAAGWLAAIGGLEQPSRASLLPGLVSREELPQTVTIAATMQKKEVRDRLIDLGADPVEGISPAQFEAYAQSELARFAKIVKQAGVKLE